MTERRAYSRTGLNALKARVKLRGLAALDRRSAGARELMAFRAALVADMGGPSEVTAAKSKLIEYATRLSLYCDVLDGYLQGLSTLVNRRSHSVWPVVRERMALGDALVRVLVQLGLERRAREVPSLSAYLEGRKAQDARTAATSTPDMDIPANAPQARAGATELPHGTPDGLASAPGVSHGDSPGGGVASALRPGTLGPGGPSVEATAEGQDATPDREPAEGLDPHVTPAGPDEVKP